jgi:hypothetical protein
MLRQPLTVQLDRRVLRELVRRDQLEALSRLTPGSDLAGADQINGGAEKMSHLYDIFVA